MASIGYGVMYLTAYANAMVAIEALAGLMGLAMGSGLMFARFSQPTARCCSAVWRSLPNRCQP